MNDDILEKGDFITAESVSEFPAESPSSKKKVLDFLSQIQEKDSNLWTSIKTIAEESKVSPVYTRNVLDSLVADEQIERAFVGKKQYFRIRKE
jgi:hypothetical protein